MKIASVAEVKAQFSAYLKESEEGLVIVTRNGRPVAALLGVRDDEELERLIQLAPAEAAGWANLGLLLLRQRSYAQRRQRRVDREQPVPRGVGVRRPHAFGTLVAQEVHVCPVIALVQRSREVGERALVARRGHDAQVPVAVGETQRRPHVLAGSELVQEVRALARGDEGRAPRRPCRRASPRVPPSGTASSRCRNPTP